MPASVYRYAFGYVARTQNTFASRHPGVKPTIFIYGPLCSKTANGRCQAVKLTLLSKVMFYSKIITYGQFLDVISPYFQPCPLIYDIRIPNFRD